MQDGGPWRHAFAGLAGFNIARAAWLDNPLLDRLASSLGTRAAAHGYLRGQGALKLTVTVSGTGGVAPPSSKISSVLIGKPPVAHLAGIVP